MSGYTPADGDTVSVKGKYQGRPNEFVQQGVLLEHGRGSGYTDEEFAALVTPHADLGEWEALGRLVTEALQPKCADPDCLVCARGERLRALRERLAGKLPGWEKR